MASATVETIADADRKTVAGAAAESQGWNIQRIKRIFAKNDAGKATDVEIPKEKVADVKPVAYWQLYR